MPKKYAATKSIVIIIENHTDIANSSQNITPIICGNAIKGAKETGYTHHINRLMVLSNVMNMCQIQNGGFTKLRNIKR